MCLSAFSLQGSCPAFIAVPLLGWFFWVTPWPVVTVPVLALASASVVAAWLQKSKTRFESVATGVYSVVMLLHIGYVVWSHATGLVWDL